jgi:MYXO-CTERM domain-containing protein
VTEGSFQGAGRVWNIGALGQNSRLSDGVQYASGIPFMANSLLGVGEELYVAGHLNECFSGTAIWNASSGGDMAAYEPFSTGVDSACYLMEELAYVHFCGDGITRPNSTEQCDTVSDSPSCDDDCTFVACGDGHVNAEAGEDCDDGNTLDGDGCPANCAFESASPPPIEIVIQPVGETPPPGDELNELDASPEVAADYTPVGQPNAVVAKGCSVAVSPQTGNGLLGAALMLGLLAFRRRKH